MAATASTTSLMAVSFTCSGETLDFSVPPRVALAEILPGVVESFGRLGPQTASAGYTVKTASGRALDQSIPLTDQNVRPGALLALVPIGQSTSDRKYDDLVEAVGVAVEDGSAAWTREDSLKLSSHASAALVLAAAALLVISSPQNALAAIVALVAALLVTGASALVARASSGESALTLALSVPVLTAVGAIALSGGEWTPIGRLTVGGGIVIGAFACFVLPQRLRPTITGPLVVGAALSLSAALTAFTRVPDDRAAALVMTLLLVGVLTAPWLSLAHVPVRVTGPDALERVDSGSVHSKVALSSVFVIAFKAGACASAILLAPRLISSFSGLLLVACMGIALMLSTRTLRSRIEVLIGVLTGMILTVGAALAAAKQSTTLAPAIAIATIVVAVILLAANVVDPKVRPWLSRAADALGIVVLLAIAPLAALVWGVL